MVDCMDVKIIDLHGNEYNINSILIKGNDDITLVIKEEHEDYISKRKARELVEKVNRKYM